MKRKKMAIYGAGSKWNQDEMKTDFFENERFTIGWNEESARDLYEAVSQLKVGDIIYLKSVSPAHIRNLKIKGIGIVTKSFIQCLQNEEYKNVNISDWNSFFIKIKWLDLEEFSIKIPDNEGKLTNIRPATFYEENLPYIQKEILNKIFTKITVK
jgi:hypothetical protein